jgi:hypothetical protein
VKTDSPALSHTTPHHTTPHHTTPHHTTPHHTSPHHTTPHHTSPHHTIQHLFVLPTADCAAKLLLTMGKERPKHVELLSFYNKTIYCDIKLDIHTYTKSAVEYY